MGLIENLFKHKYRHGSHHSDHGYDERYHHDRHSDDDFSRVLHGYGPTILRYGMNIIRNKKILYALIALGLMGLVLLAALLFFLVPLIFRAIDYVSQSGLKGLVDSVIQIINQLWEGQGSRAGEESYALQLFQGSFDRS